MRRSRHLLPILMLACRAGGLGGLPSGLAAQTAPGVDDPLGAELAEVRQATARYRDVGVAVQEGYVRSRIGFDFPLMGEHWVNRELLDRPMDLLRPAFLQYVDVGGSRELVGVAYAQWRRPGDPLPEGFVGDEDHWHGHRLSVGARESMGHRDWSVRGAAHRRQAGAGYDSDGPVELAMLHVWLWSDNPEGVFAAHNPALPYLRAGLPEAWARPDDRAAPRAIALLVPGACRTLIDRLEWVAGAGTLPASELAHECDRAAERVRVALRGGAGGDAFNAVAASAWLDFLEGAREAVAPEGITDSDESGEGSVETTHGAGRAHR